MADGRRLRRPVETTERPKGRPGGLRAAGGRASVAHGRDERGRRARVAGGVVSAGGGRCGGAAARRRWRARTPCGGEGPPFEPHRSSAGLEGGGGAAPITAIGAPPATARRLPPAQ